MSDITKLKGVMTLAELKETPEFADCSDKMKAWIVAVIVNGFDYTAATAATFACKYPQAFSHSVRQWPAVRATLNVYRGMSAFEIWMEDVRRAARRRKTSISQIQALKLQADAMGWNSEGLDERLHGKKPKVSDAAETSKPPAPASVPPATPKRFKVGDLIVERDDQGVEHRGRVLAVDTEGAITDAEEFPT